MDNIDISHLFIGQASFVASMDCYSGLVRIDDEQEPIFWMEFSTPDLTKELITYRGDETRDISHLFQKGRLPGRARRPFTATIDCYSGRVQVNTMKSNLRTNGQFFNFHAPLLTQQFTEAIRKREATEDELPVPDSPPPSLPLPLPRKMKELGTASVDTDLFCAATGEPRVHEDLILTGNKRQKTLETRCRDNLPEGPRPGLILTASGTESARRGGMLAVQAVTEYEKTKSPN